MPASTQALPRSLTAAATRTKSVSAFASIRSSPVTSMTTARALVAFTAARSRSIRCPQRSSSMEPITGTQRIWLHTSRMGTDRARIAARWCSMSVSFSWISRSWASSRARASSSSARMRASACEAAGRRRRTRLTWRA
ncbi:hypothetical protein BE20_25420 [Sorangium cellulosum]|nr:hypothetical protein BE20_25420 [Sorangium cellulosum]